MHDEFRIRVELAQDDAVQLLEALEQVEREAGDGPSSQPKHVAVSHEGGHVFLYADSAEDAVRARATVESILTEQRVEDVAAKVSSWRWHPEEDRWEDAAQALPSTPAEHAVEHARLEQLESEESQQGGHVEWEVRVTLPTHHDAHAFAQRLEAEGMPLRRHWRHLQLGTRDEDEARALAERLRAEAPQGSTFEIEGDALDAWAAINAPARPFAFFGGLAQ